MFNFRLYALSFGDIVLLFVSLVTDIDPVLRTVGLLIGIVVGVLTSMKMWQDWKLKKIENKIKKLKLEEILNDD